MSKTTMIAAILLAAAASPALAQEGATSDSVSVGGFYAGAEVGYGKPKHKLDLTPKTGGATSGSADKTGFEYGGFMGYGAVIGESFYIGGEASLGAGGGKASRTLSSTKVTIDPGLRYGAAARAGLAFDGGGLLYGKVGLERRKFEVSTIGAKKKLNAKGLVYGVGYEQALNDNVGLRGEISRVNYDDKSVTFSTGDKVKFDSKETRLTLGAIVRF